MLDLCLWSLSEAGIQHVVLAFHEDQQREQAVDQLGSRNHGIKIDFFRDEGVGVHGIPSQALEQLDEVFVFEAGHGVSAPNHYRSLIATKRPGNAVFSAFRPAKGNTRYEVEIPMKRCGSVDRWALAQPMVVDHEWATTVAEQEFSVNMAAEAYRRRGRLEVVPSGLPVEFDTYAEYRRTRNLLELNMKSCRARTPWRSEPIGEPSTDIHATAALLA